ncbi:PRKCA-binding protein-like [Acyrthosiphon pisum]|uniref:PRKCA-binding protein n=1 Tax=Acyrthosiphon pisum TaxID=7029 RepID=A0A8R1W076_ACYPI|nr:PRKCA-binding protein-like [Acyrthosiphon pisum]|eukprot:XP_001946500.2 PREDICTED: PRKCA-binding protein-like [Acyrthosiphon pisum]
MSNVNPCENMYNDHCLHLNDDKKGMKVTSGIVKINKDTKSNRIGLTIDGGPPHCPCIYITQVLEDSPAALDGTLESGDEILAINNERVSGRHKSQVSKMIESSSNPVIFKYNKLHADVQQGKTLDIVLKKFKQRLVENISNTVADYLCMSRAIIVDDSLVKRLQQLENLEETYRCLVDHLEHVLNAFYDLTQCYKEFGESFAEIAVREPQPRASESLMRFSEYHRQMERQGLMLIEVIKPISRSFGTYLNKAIPDTKQTIRKYADVKFEFLSYCLKVTELDTAQKNTSSTCDPVYRIETGNYEYRLLLRCRQIARKRFFALRKDVLTKIELLESKHVYDVVDQFQIIASQVTSFNHEISWMINGGDRDDNEPPIFPIEMDLKCTAFEYNSVQPDLNDESVIVYECEES